MTATDTEKAEYRGESLAVRGVIGGGLMGLANLVPGISGGTMLLAAGVYPQFIRAVADVSMFRLNARAILLLVCIVGAAAAAIGGFAGTVGELVVNHRWAMYSLFIGLTLGGVPILWRLVKPLCPTVVTAAVLGIIAMAAMTLVRPDHSAAVVNEGHPYLLLFVAGLAGASAMVLPGVSGGYLLLVLGQYLAVLTAIDLFTDGLRGRDWNAITESLHTVIPVGLGVVVGVVGVSNVVKILLEKCRRATLGVLLGLLLGAVIGIWPFQEGVAPEAGTIFRGEFVVETDEGLILETSGRPVEAEDYPTRAWVPLKAETASLRPSGLRLAGAMGLIAVGLAGSMAVSRLGRGAETA